MRNRRIVLASAVAFLLAAVGHRAAAAAQAPPEKAKAGPALGTVTGTYVLDGKPIALHTAVAIAFANPFDEKKKAFKVALTPAPVVPDPRAADTAVDRLDQGVTTGITIDMDDAPHCMFLVVRDPSLGERRLAKTGNVCAAGAVTIVGAARVEGTVTSFPEGKEETISGHQVSYTLHFNAPVTK